MRIAVAQMPGTSLDAWRQTLAQIDDALAQAREHRAELVVLPECVWPAYCLGSRAAYRAARHGGLPAPEFFLDHLSQAARAHHMAVCAGYVEERGERLFNAAALVDVSGEVRGVHRKCFLWDFDHDYFEPGETIEPMDTSLGRIGVLICADARLPEIPATLAARGAHLLLQPTGWVNAGTPERLWNPQPDFLVAARAAEFGVPIASASKWGLEGQTVFVGSSLICDATGEVLVQCRQRETTIAVAEVMLRPPRRAEMTAAERGLLLSPSSTRRAGGGPVPGLWVRVVPDVSDATELEAIVCETARRACAEPTLWLARPKATAAPVSAVRQIENALIAGGSVDWVHELGAARVAAVRAQEARTFAAIRRRALEGAHVVVVQGNEVGEQAIRARASENRVFIVWVETAGVTVVGPTGQFLHRLHWAPGSSAQSGVRLDTRLAVDKRVTNETDVLADRRPTMYAF
jgi:predicted amidohydrolase